MNEDKLTRKEFRKQLIPNESHIIIGMLDSLLLANFKVFNVPAPDDSLLDFNLPTQIICVTATSTT